MKTATKMTVNSLLTRRVAQLHEKGFEYDFTLNKDRSIFCVQQNTTVAGCGLIVRLIDQVYDHLFGNYKYLHTVEMDSGERGILLSPDIYFQQTQLLTD